MTLNEDIVEHSSLPPKASRVRAASDLVTSQVCFMSPLKAFQSLGNKSGGKCWYKGW